MRPGRSAGNSDTANLQLNADGHKPHKNMEYTICFRIGTLDSGEVLPRFADMASRPRPQLYVAQSLIHGLGVFSATHLRKGACLYTVTGTTVSFPYDDDPDLGSDWIGHSYETWLVPHSANLIRYTNHSCSPNVIVSDGFAVLALCAIRPADELVMDYATTEIDPLWQMPCTCRSRLCRKVIRACQHLPHYLRVSYEPLMVPPLLQGLAMLTVRTGHAAH